MAGRKLSAKAAPAIARKKPVPRKAKETAFDDVVSLIQQARQRAYAAVNTTLIDLYWQIGEHISKKVASENWGEGTVELLAQYIAARQPNARGFSAQNLWRMRQFYEAYRKSPILSPLARELSWTNNMAILSRCKRDEEREFYLRLCLREKWGKRELERQLKSALFERTVLSPVILSTPLTEMYPEAIALFKDSYMLDFLDLPLQHSESDLQRGLVGQLQSFLIELGRDFCFVGREYPLQVGGRDFAVDLLFFNRALNALVAFELKIEEFEPAHLGQLEFYLEALDRKLRKPHERPSIGVLLCATKDSEVVEFALSRSLSPALVAEYQTQLPDKKILQAKLHEFYAISQGEGLAKPKALRKRK
jgi:predicted nuclease of restriction endonuclease-like (RecB) superfamily